MKKIYTLTILALAPLFIIAQTLYVPSGTGGIGNNTTNGNVGIGTFTPELSTHILGSSGFPTTSGTSQIGVLRLQGSGSNGVLDFSINAGSGAALQVTNRSNLSLGYSLLLNPNGGNVGIGTTTPRAPLEVHVTGNNNSVQTGLIIQQKNTGSPNNAAGVSLDFGIGNNYNNNNIEGRITLKETYWAARPKMFFSLWDEYNMMQDRMVLDTYGNVGIGTTAPDAKLAVNGTIHSKEVKVDLTGWPDYVFNDDYKLLSLSEIKTYIDKNKHLPEVPSAKEIEANGVNLGEMNMLLLKKIEELTLHIICQNNHVNELQEGRAGADASARKVEELTLYVIEQQKQLDVVGKQIDHLNNLVMKK